jgi:capsular exopolysaccharide synthesis family protein
LRDDALHGYECGPRGPHRPARAATQGESTMELLKVYAALLRRKWIFLQAVVFFVVGAGLLALLLPKRYEAAARISVESSDAELSILSDMDLSEMAQTLSGSSDDMQTKIALAQMRPILEEVVWRLQLRDSDGELLAPEKLLVPGLDGEILAMPSVEISEQQGTNILIVTGTGNTPELSVLLADTLVEVFLAKSVEDGKEDTRQALAFVKAEQLKLQAQFDTALANVATALRNESVIDLDTETKAAVARASTLVSEIGATDAELAEVEAQLRKRAELNETESVSMVAPGTIATNTQVRELRSALTELRLARDKAMLEKTARHPDVLLLDSQIASVQKELEGALREEHDLDPAIEALRVQFAGLLERRAELTRLVQETVEQAGEYPEKGRRLAELQLAADATQSIYKSLIEQEYQIAVAEAMTASDLKGVEPAKAPDKPSAPKLLVYIVLGGVLGVGAGLGLVFLFEYVDDSFRHPDDLREVWPLPVLGLVPRYRLKGTSIIAGLLPTDPLFESYRSIRNGIAFAGVDQRIDVITVTSSAPGEGKSTFVTNLAVCLANDGQRVVVVDCDLRRPTQHRAFPTIGNSVGVSSVLAQSNSLAEALQDTPVANLKLLTSGPIPSNPGKLVESLRLRQMLTELSRMFDVVLVDAPPVLAVSDALSLSRASRGTIVVIEAESTTRRMLTDVRTQMENASIEPIGVVFNKVRIGAGGYGYYHRYTQLYARGAEGPPKAQGEAS